MASDESTTMFSSMADEEFEDTDDGFDHHHHQNNLSRLSVCTSSLYTNDDDQDVNNSDMTMFMSKLSIDSFDGEDADAEFSDEGIHRRLPKLISSDSDEKQGCYSLPATPPHRRKPRSGCVVDKSSLAGKEYASDNDAMVMWRKKMRKQRRVKREKINSCDMHRSGISKKTEDVIVSGCGDSDHSGCGLMVITRPIGGNKSLCMDMEEVKACRELGFELEPVRVSLSTGSTTHDTSSGGTSPIANWCISNHGDNPRDVKARLKMWAQAVAFASSSRLGI